MERGSQDAVLLECETHPSAEHLNVFTSWWPGSCENRLYKIQEKVITTVILTEHSKSKEAISVIVCYSFVCTKKKLPLI